MFVKQIENGYVMSIGVGSDGAEITQDEYDEIMRIIADRPTAPDGYCYRLRADTLEYELCELPAPTDEADTQDYENALGRFGV